MAAFGQPYKNSLHLKNMLHSALFLSVFLCAVLLGPTYLLQLSLGGHAILWG